MAKEKSSGLLKFPSDGRADGPRVTFSSFTWEGNRPLLSNAPSVRKGGNVTTTTLYLPAGFSENYISTWGEEEAVTVLVDPTGQDSFKASAYEALDNGTKGQLGGLNTTVKYDSGQTSFPGQFSVFKRSEPMALTFNYDLLPRNAKEAAEVQTIISTFKQQILPVFKGGKLRFPNIWDIHFLQINGPGFPATPKAYQNLALIGCNVAYGGGAQSALTFSDQNPVIITLNLQFKSIKHSYLEG
jgi:hypothetical protein